MDNDQTRFERLEAVIRSEQVPQEETHRILNNNPTFAAWYRVRAEARQKESRS
ncbi:MAG: hypothetical protein QG584_2631 [Pseudomonadota bacterium]|nr:hypothetical protein [Pseudomonadota bacterium]